MTRDQIAVRVNRLVADQSGINIRDLVPENTITDLSFDSLDCIELLLELEGTFNIRIPDRDADNLKTINELIDYLAGLKDVQGM